MKIHFVEVLLSLTKTTSNHWPREKKAMLLLNNHHQLRASHHEGAIQHLVKPTSFWKNLGILELKSLCTYKIPFLQRIGGLVQAGYRK